jgi:predicted HicB family RNase H-like nuclease
LDRRGILVRVSPELRRRLKLTALNRGLTVQALMLEAIAEVLKKPDRPPEP